VSAPFIGKTGTPSAGCVSRAALMARARHKMAFVKELRTVDPNVTGTPGCKCSKTPAGATRYVQAAAVAWWRSLMGPRWHVRRLGSVFPDACAVAVGRLAGRVDGFLHIPFNGKHMTPAAWYGIGVTQTASDFEPVCEAQKTGHPGQEPGHRRSLSPSPG